MDNDVNGISSRPPHIIEERFKNGFFETHIILHESSDVSGQYPLGKK